MHPIKFRVTLFHFQNKASIYLLVIDISGKIWQGRSMEMYSETLACMQSGPNKGTRLQRLKYIHRKKRESIHILKTFVKEIIEIVFLSMIAL